jgi:hypothetical protein
MPQGRARTFKRRLRRGEPRLTSGGKAVAESHQAAEQWAFIARMARRLLDDACEFFQVVDEAPVFEMA